jgi:hypothetical protein
VAPRAPSRARRSDGCPSGGLAPAEAPAIGTFFLRPVCKSAHLLLTRALGALQYGRMAKGPAPERRTQHRLRMFLADLGAVALALAALSGCSSPRDRSSQSSASTAVPSTRFPALSLVGSARLGHWARFRVDSTDHVVDVYVAHDAQPKSVVILIPGSGCAPLVTVDPDGTLHDTTLFQDLIAPRLRRLHFAIVEKRGVDPLRFSEGMSQRDKLNDFSRAGRDCSSTYLKNVTKHTRVEDIAVTVRALARQPWARQIILAGHS